MSTLITEEFARDAVYDGVTLYKIADRHWRLLIERGTDPNDGLPLTVCSAVIMTEEEFHRLVEMFCQPQCRVCGCTQDDCEQCVEKTGDACEWVEADLCSACVGESRDKGQESRARKKTGKKTAKKREAKN